LERPNQTSGVGRPALGEAGNDLRAALLGPHQAFEHLPGDAERLAVAGQRGVEDLRITRHSEDELVLLGRGGALVPLALASGEGKADEYGGSEDRGNGSEPGGAHRGSPLRTC